MLNKKELNKIAFFISGCVSASILILSYKELKEENEKKMKKEKKEN